MRGHQNRRTRKDFWTLQYLFMENAVLTLIIAILIIVVLGAILFWAIDKFCPDARLAQLLKLLVVLVCLGAIVARLLPLIGYSSFI